MRTEGKAELSAYEPFSFDAWEQEVESGSWPCCDSLQYPAYLLALAVCQLKDGTLVPHNQSYLVKT